MPTRNVIGIDLGTAYSCAGVWKDGRVEILVDEDGNRTVPSFVAFTDTEVLLGSSAKNQRARNPANTIFDIKRLIGRKFSDPSVQAHIKLLPFKVVSGAGDKPMIAVNTNGRERQFSPEVIAGMILEKLKTTAEKYLGGQVHDAVITVPTHFTDLQRQATKDAGTIAGLNVLRIINEPSAAALAYVFGKEGIGEKKVVFYNMGSGGVDVSLIEIDCITFEVLATAGKKDLGGDVFDSRILDFCVEDFKQKHPDKNLAGDERAMRHLRAQCERAKRALSSGHRATISVDLHFEDIDYSCSLSRSYFEELCADYFRDCLNPIERCLRDADVRTYEVDEVVLAGGSTRIPRLQQLIKEFFDGLEPDISLDPDEAAAFGATLQVAFLGGHPSSWEHLLLNVIPFSLGLETGGGVMTKLIERNTTVPVRKVRTFTTQADDQPGIVVKVFEGEREETKYNDLLGTFHLEGLLPAPRGVPQIEVSFDIDADGILNVSAEDTATRRRTRLTLVSWTGHRSRADLDRMVTEYQAFRAEDWLRPSRIRVDGESEHCSGASSPWIADSEDESDARLKEMKPAFEAQEDLEVYCSYMEVVLEMLGSRDKEKAQQALRDTMQWMQQNQLASKDDYEAKLIDLKSVLDPLVRRCPHPFLRRSRSHQTAGTESVVAASKGRPPNRVTNAGPSSGNVARSKRRRVTQAVARVRNNTRLASLESRIQRLEAGQQEILEHVQRGFAELREELRHRRKRSGPPVGGDRSRRRGSGDRAAGSGGGVAG